MYAHCGWSGAILGTAGGMLGVAELVVGIHIGSTAAVACACVQFMAWNFVLGVQDTGWSVHYVALSIFFMSMLSFHYLVGSATPYSNRFYRRLNVVALCLVIVFMSTFILRAISPEGQYKAYVSLSVCVEFGIMAIALMQHLCMAYGMASGCTITLTFEDQP